METGKLPSSRLVDMLSKYTGKKRPEVLLAGALGEDCSFVRLGETTLVLTMDPVTAAQSDQGTIAFHVNLNDLATSGAAPLGVMVTLLLPKSSPEGLLDEIMGQLHDLCSAENIQILGGHTEVTDSVSRPVVVVCAIGTVPAGEEIFSSKVAVGDGLVVSKSLGMEGTVIMQDFAQGLDLELSPQEQATIDDMAKNLSVIRDGLIGKAAGVHAMHDVTEGGILGAAWEMSRGSGHGVLLKEDKFPFEPVTRKLADAFDLDVNRLISSGAMLFATPDPQGLIKALKAEGISGSLIGEITESQERILEDARGHKQTMTGPTRDEIYRLYE